MGSERRWFQPLYVDPRDGILKRTDRLDWSKGLGKPRPAKPADRLALSETRELRQLQSHWFEVTLAPLPARDYRTILRPAPPARSGGARDVAVRQLVTPAVVDAVTGQAARAGPELDEPRAWAVYNKDHPSRTYAVGKRQLCRAELRRHGLTNGPSEGSGSPQTPATPLSGR